MLVAEVKIPLPTTSRVDVGVVVPMPTLVLLVAPLTPLIEPSTKALDSLTTALVPIAVAFCSWVDVPGPDW